MQAETVSVPAAAGAAARQTADRPNSLLMRRLLAWYRPDAKGISRPKLLFTLLLVDIAVVVASALAVLSGIGQTGALLATAWGLALAIVVVTALRLQRGYSIQALRRARFQALQVAIVLATGLCILAGVGFLAGVAPVDRGPALGWIGVAFVGLVAVRVAMARLIEALAAAGLLVRRTVIVGGGTEAEQLIDRIDRAEGSHIEILGIFDDRTDGRVSAAYSGYARIGTFEELAEFCRTNGVELLIVALPLTAEHRLLQVLHRLFELPADIRISALNSRLPLSARLFTQVAGVPMLPVMDKPLNDWDRVIKNVEDRVLAAILLVLALPVMAVCALAVRLESKGPVLFRQKRYGFDNELVEVFKFRSMYVDQADADARKLVTRDDPRVTRVGRFLRRSSLDELPQLINVLKGEMSLVGPRPHATQAKAAGDLYEHVVLGYFARHRVKPGVTGWAQINGWRGETDTSEKLRQRVEHDLHYIDNWSVALDLYIIAVTPFALLRGKNAF